MRRVIRPIRRETRRRAAVEPVIGDIEAGPRLGRLKGLDGDRITAIPADVRTSTVNARDAEQLVKIGIPFDLDQRVEFLRRLSAGDASCMHFSVLVTGVQPFGRGVRAEGYSGVYRTDLCGRDRHWLFKKREPRNGGSHN